MEGYEAGLYSDSTLWHYQGTEAYGEWALHMPELIVEPASGTSFAVMEWSNLTMANLPPGLHPENLPSQMTGGEQVCVSYSGVPTEVGLYPVLVSGELTVTLFGNPYVVGPYNVVGTIEVLDNPNPIPGARMETLRTTWCSPTLTMAVVCLRDAQKRKHAIINRWRQWTMALVILGCAKPVSCGLEWRWHREHHRLARPARVLWPSLRNEPR